jgi:hypothetical protein
VPQRHPTPSTHPRCRPVRGVCPSHGRLRGGTRQTFTARPTDASDLIDVHDPECLAARLADGTLVAQALPGLWPVHHYDVVGEGEGGGGCICSDSGCGAGAGDGGCSVGGSGGGGGAGAGPSSEGQGCAHGERGDSVAEPEQESTSELRQPAGSALLVAYSLPSRPGFLLLPGALAPCTQLHLMRAALTEVRARAHMDIHTDLCAHARARAHAHIDIDVHAHAHAHT